MGIFSDIETAADLLLSGQLVAIPTETVYGLAGNALDEHVVAKIFEAKNRPSFDPLIVHVPSKEAAHQIAHVSPLAERLIDQFSPGPLTLILPKKSTIPDLVTSGHNTVGIRIPSHPLTLQLLDRCGFPLAAPSANPFGYTSPTTAEHVDSQLGDRIGGVLDGGPCGVGVESTIIDLSGAHLKVLRHGGMPIEDLEEFLGHTLEEQLSSSSPNAPGMLVSHYNPGIPLRLFDTKDELLGSLELINNEGIGVLHLGEALGLDQEYSLSEESELVEAASHLFKGLRAFDPQKVSEIWAHKVQAEGLGRAINDRLQRAAK